MTIKHIFVVGVGTMGNGIAQTAPVSGYNITMMRLVEVVRGLQTSDETTETTVAVSEKRGKIITTTNSSRKVS